MTLKVAASSDEPEKRPALPAKAASADLRTLLDQLVKLGLDFAAEALPAILTRAVKEDLGTPALLEQLLRGELERREERRIRTSPRLSGLPSGQIDRWVSETLSATGTLYTMNERLLRELE